MRHQAVVIAFVLLAACGSDRQAITPTPTPELAPRGAEPVVGVSPIHPENRPTPIAGQLNGRVDDSDLVTVEGECREARAAAASLARLLASARAHGVQLSPGDCYRPYSDQITVRTGSCAKGNCACAGRPGGSMHGWGKAVDLHDEDGSITSFTQKSYLWLKANAARFGWNHPRALEPPTSSCPEAWHWEWVGDGGRMGADPVRVDVIGLVPSRAGYNIVSATGGATARGDATVIDAPATSHLVVATAPARDGHWMVTAAGDVVSVGGAPVLSRAAGERPVAIASNHRGTGAWIASADGRVTSLGTAPKLADAPPAAQPVVGAATSTTRGLWLVTKDGTVVARGNARVHSPPRALEDTVGIAATSTGKGYWLAASDGRVLAFGDANRHRSLTPRKLRSRVVSIVPTRTGDGYWLVTTSGGVFAFGDATFYGAEAQ